MVGRAHRTVLLVAFPYAGILVFSAFGPVLTRLLPLEQAIAMGALFLLVLAGSMIPSPGEGMAFERGSGYLQWLIGISAVAIALFGAAPPWLRWIMLVVSAFGLGRIAAFWSRHFLSTVAMEQRGRTMGLVLTLAYGILYLFNLLTPSLPPPVLTPLVGLLVLATIPFSLGLPAPQIFAFSAAAKPLPTGCRGRGLPVLPLSVIFLVYTVAGFSYTAMLPTLATVPADRFINVLPFVLVVGAVGLLSDRRGRMFLLYGGVGALGIALILFQIPHGTMWYAGSQSMIQIGWAFLDLFVWVWAADLVFCYRNPRLQNLGVAAFLLGTSVGAAGTGLVYELLMEQEWYFVFAIPLFVGVALLGSAAPREPDLPTHRGEITAVPAALAAHLTQREQEVALLLANQKSNREITETLHVSPNTLKTHCRSIYRKLNVRDRQELHRVAAEYGEG